MMLPTTLTPCFATSEVLPPKSNRLSQRKPGQPPLEKRGLLRAPPLLLVSDRATTLPVLRRLCRSICPVAWSCLSVHCALLLDHRRAD